MGGDATAGMAEVEERLARARAALEDSLLSGTADDTVAARADLTVALVTFGDLAHDIEARYHLSRLPASESRSGRMAVAMHLAAGDVTSALASLSDAIAVEGVGGHPSMLPLAFTALARMGDGCPRTPWLLPLVERLPTMEERVAAAAHLLAVTPAETGSRAALAESAVAGIVDLWRTSRDLAIALLDSTCRALVRHDDQRLLAIASGRLLDALADPPTDVRSYLGYLLVTSQFSVGDLPGVVSSTQTFLNDFLVGAAWSEPGNFRLLTSVITVLADTAMAAMTGGLLDTAAEAVATADRAMNTVQEIDASVVPETPEEHGDTEYRLSLAFSRLLEVTRSLSLVSGLPVSDPDPPPIISLPAAAPTTQKSSPGRVARISEARFRSACALVDWKVIPTPQEVDFGLDFRIEIPDTPGRTSTDVEFLVQLKGTTQAPNASGHLTARVRENTLDYWKSKVLPTLVVLVHLPSDKLYTSWFFPALDDVGRRTFRFTHEDEWDPVTLRTDVHRYYEMMRLAVASGGDWSVLSVMQFHCALLVRTLLIDPHLRRAALDPTSNLRDARPDQMTLTLLSMHHRALTAPVPILAGQTNASRAVELLRTLDAIIRSWTVSGPQSHPDVRLSIVATNKVMLSARDLLHVAVELDCALASAVVEAQEERSAARAAAQNVAP